jgi:hypothetical protein
LIHLTNTKSGKSRDVPINRKASGVIEKPGDTGEFERGFPAQCEA